MATLPYLGSPTSARVRGIVAAVARGRTNEEIAEDLGLSRFTIKSHLSRIGARYGVTHRAGIVHAAYKRGDLAGLAPEPRTLPPLADRERQVLDGMSRGLDNAAIGRELFISEDTVKTHARRLFRKLRARDRAHAVALGHQHALLIAPAELVAL
ncbi:DNA-binding NarL/FixJ family response regulator [Streptacidiphilus sp. MAP5-52]